jgi:hypothetical protein
VRDRGSPYGLADGNGQIQDDYEAEEELNGQRNKVDSRLQVPLHHQVLSRRYLLQAGGTDEPRINIQDIPAVLQRDPARRAGT